MTRYINRQNGRELDEMQIWDQIRSIVYEGKSNPEDFQIDAYAERYDDWSFAGSYRRNSFLELA